MQSTLPLENEFIRNDYLSGFDILEQLKLIIPSTVYMPVLVLTADITSESKRKALQSGASDFLTKPFDLIELKARVNTHLQIRLKNKQISNYALELEKLVATKDKFFSIIAHDLRNPFVGIESFTKILLTLGTYDSEDIKKQLKTIHNTAQQGHELLENLLRWAHSQTDSIQINTDVFVLRESVQTCFEVIKVQAENKGVTLHNNIDNSILIDTDRDIFETIIRNLISNSVKFTSLGGRVELNAEIVEDFVEISVKDTGVGISPDVLTKLFQIDKNLQTHKGTAGEKGSGLGLILCKEFIDKLGGTIWCESEVDKGTTFRFKLPHLTN